MMGWFDEEFRTFMLRFPLPLRRDCWVCFLIADHRFDGCCRRLIVQGVVQLWWRLCIFANRSLGIIWHTLPRFWINQPKIIRSLRWNMALMISQSSLLLGRGLISQFIVSHSIVFHFILFSYPIPFFVVKIEKVNGEKRFVLPGQLEEHFLAWNVTPWHVCQPLCACV